jgi:hypothetical protein
LVNLVLLLKFRIKLPKKYCLKQVDFYKLNFSFEEAKEEAEIHMKLDNPSIVKVSSHFQEGEFF